MLRRQSFNPALVGASAFFVALLTLGGCGEGDAERAVRLGLRDPDAAQFRDVKQCGGDATVWRGEVNGKNAFGAYTGFKSFYYADRSVIYAGDPTFIDMMNRCFPEVAKAATPGVAATNDPGLRDINENDPKPPPSEAPSPLKNVNPEDQYGDAETEGPGRPNLAEAPECWGGYCPCDKSDPDYGYFDITLCRKVEMGRPISDSEFEIGAGSRDARKALREWKENHGGSF